MENGNLHHFIVTNDFYRNLFAFGDIGARFAFPFAFPTIIGGANDIPKHSGASVAIHTITPVEKLTNTNA